MLSGDTVVGFAGPVYPEPTGRGYFAGIGIHPDYQHHGLGKILFYHLCEEEKRAGAKYMSLFTGEGNPARNIYKQAGFSEVRRFGVMLKDLQ
jgi:ribosomal protein S18 acetylase RimI-like enzyme